MDSKSAVDDSSNDLRLCSFFLLRHPFEKTLASRPRFIVIGKNVFEFEEIFFSQFKNRSMPVKVSLKHSVMSFSRNALN